MRLPLQFSDRQSQLPNEIGDSDDDLQEDAQCERCQTQQSVFGGGNCQFYVDRYGSDRQFLSELSCLVEYSFSGENIIYFIFYLVCIIYY